MSDQPLVLAESTPAEIFDALKSLGVRLDGKFLNALRRHLGLRQTPVPATRGIANNHGSIGSIVIICIGSNVAVGTSGNCTQSIDT